MAGCVLCLFLAVPWVGLPSVIGAFHCNTHFFNLFQHMPRCLDITAGVVSTFNKTAMMVLDRSPEFLALLTPLLSTMESFEQHYATVCMTGYKANHGYKLWFPL